MWAVPVLHPAFTFRQPMALGPLQAHVNGFVWRGVRGFEKPPRLEENPTASRLRWLVNECKKQKTGLAVDIESAPPGKEHPSWALLPGFARLRAFGVGAAIGPGIGLSWEYPVIDFDVWRAFREACADTKLVKVYCNGYAFDIPMLARYGVRHRGVVHDIRDGRRALVSTSRVGLGPQAAMYLHCGPWKQEALEDESDEKGYVDASRIGRKKLLRYNAEDTVRTAQIRVHHIREFKEDADDKERRQTLYEQQIRLARVAAQMHLDGFPVDRKEQQRLSSELARVARARAAVLRRLVRPYEARRGAFRITDTGGVNDTDLRALLYRECAKPGIRSFELEVPFSDKCRTDTGMAAVNKDALLFLFAQDNCPPEVKEIVKACWKANAPLKAKSTFVDSELVEAAIGPDGRMHPKLNSCGTETGRWSSSKPNLFNLPEAQDEDDSIRGDLPSVRSMYVAPPGYVIVHRDYKQLELEVMAERTGDALLRRMLDTGDAHTARVHEWFGVPVGAPVPKLLRRQGKVVGFACQYGAGVETVYLKVLESVPEARFEDVAALHELYPQKHVGIAENWTRALRFAEEHGYNETPIMNRRRYYPPGDRLQITEPLNYEIQGGAADIANGTMVGRTAKEFKNSLTYRLKKHFPKAWLAMHVYDSFDIICPKRDAKAVDKMLEECMAGPWRIGAKDKFYKSDGKIGQRWSEV